MSTTTSTTKNSASKANTDSSSKKASVKEMREFLTGCKELKSNITQDFQVVLVSLRFGELKKKEYMKLMFEILNELKEKEVTLNCLKEFEEGDFSDEEMDKAVKRGVKKCLEPIFNSINGIEPQAKKPRKPRQKKAKSVPSLTAT